jgi:hypothetical protein
MSRRRIAFVYVPGLGLGSHAPDRVRLETMPFAINTIMRLANADWRVDVFLWERPLVDYHEIFPRTVRFRYEAMPKRIFYGMRPIRLTARFMSCTNYECAFGLGQIGSYLGAIISLASRCPLVLLNDEFPSQFGPSQWSALERWAAQRARVVIVPSADRIPRLAEELGLSDQKERYVEFRNAAKVSRPLEKRDWHALLEIPSGQRIFLECWDVERMESAA